MQQTPLIRQHRASGAKLVDFAGWEMPIQYSGVVDEYHTVRSHVGLFDVSHMGRLRIAGTGAISFLQRVTTNDVGKLAVSQPSTPWSVTSGGIEDGVLSIGFRTSSLVRERFEPEKIGRGYNPSPPRQGGSS